MFKKCALLLAAVACLPINAMATPKDATAPQLYLNKNLGFNVKGYNYGQSEFPCEVDAVLVDQIVKVAGAENIKVEATGSAAKLRQESVPVLAIDIEALALGTKEFTFGTEFRGQLPSVKVTAALINKAIPEGFVTASHSCAIATLNEVTPSSSVLDLGSNGVTVCSATHRCLEDLGKDIVQWLEPQIR